LVHLNRGLGSLEGCKIVAGGRRPPERNSIVRRHPEGVQDVPISRHKALAPLQGANYQDAPGGLRSAPTSGYFLTTLRVASTYASPLL